MTAPGEVDAREAVLRRQRRQDRSILLSWGLAVLVLAGLFAWWTQRNAQEADRQAAEVKRQQDVAMCDMIDLFTAGPPPVAGPAGDRGRVVLAAMRAYQATLHCDEARRGR